MHKRVNSFRQHFVIFTTYVLVKKRDNHDGGDGDDVTFIDAQAHLGH